MKAVVHTEYGSPDVLEIKEAERPTPVANEVLVKVHATTVTPVDCIFLGGDDFLARLFTGITKPKNPVRGAELSGVIEAVGKNVNRFKVGDRVFGGGSGHVEYICLSEDGPLEKIPDNMSYEEAAAVPYGVLTALPFLRDSGNIQSGQKVLINGASGSIGTYAVQLAKFFGAVVTGVCSGANVELVKSLGADKVIDYTKEDFTENGETWDIIFDTVGMSSFSLCKNTLSENGIYLTTVLSFAILPQMLWMSKFGSKKVIFSATGLRTPEEQAKDLNFIKGLLEAGTSHRTLLLDGRDCRCLLLC
jgi:NADPH:quinone reductase-like Zn-dependent oxidoreductase